MHCLNKTILVIFNGYNIFLVVAVLANGDAVESSVIISKMAGEKRK